MFIDLPMSHWLGQDLRFINTSLNRHCAKPVALFLGFIGLVCCQTSWGNLAAYYPIFLWMTILQLETLVLSIAKAMHRGSCFGDFLDLISETQRSRPSSGIHRLKITHRMKNRGFGLVVLDYDRRLIFNYPRLKPPSAMRDHQKPSKPFPSLRQKLAGRKPVWVVPFSIRYTFLSPRLHGNSRSFSGHRVVKGFSTLLCLPGQV